MSIRKNEYERALESLKRRTDAYIALLVSRAFVSVTMLLSVILYNLCAHRAPVPSLSIAPRCINYIYPVRDIRHQQKKVYVRIRQMLVKTRLCANA